MKKARKSISFTGRGGTSFVPVIEYFAANKGKYDGLIVFTDGYAPPPVVPQSLRQSVCWIATNKQAFEDNAQWMSERGPCCYIGQI